MPTHHNPDRYLEEYIAAAGIAPDKKGPFFRTSRGRDGELAERPLLQSDVWRMIRRRAAEAGIDTEVGCQTFRATGITAHHNPEAGWRLPSRWLPMSRPARRGSTTGAAMKSRSMR
jgi:hypothetical protein